MKTRLLIIIGIVVTLVVASSTYVVLFQTQCESLLGDRHYPRPLTFWNCMGFMNMIQENPEPVMKPIDSVPKKTPQPEPEQSSKQIAIQSIKSVIDSDASYDEIINTIEKKSHEKNLGMFSSMFLKNLKQNYDHGENIEFDTVAFGNVNWCLMPQVRIFYDGYERPLFEDGVRHSCPPPHGNSFPSIVIWGHESFNETFSCMYDGNYTIMGGVYMFEWQKLGQFYCNGGDEFVPPPVHHMSIVVNEKGLHQLRFLPDSVTAQEGDVFQFTNDSDEEFWLIARHDSDVEQDVSLHFDPFESREFSHMQSGNYTVSIEVDHHPISLNSTIMVK